MVERYWPGVTVDKFQRSLDDTWPNNGVSETATVRYLGSLLFPTDEVVFYMFDGPSLGAVEQASRAAQLPFERVLECLWDEPSRQLQTKANGSGDEWSRD